jgi:3-methyladenine DNA glycosylase AlkD
MKQNAITPNSSTNFSANSSKSNSIEASSLEPDSAKSSPHKSNHKKSKANKATIAEPHNNIARSNASVHEAQESEAVKPNNAEPNMAGTEILARIKADLLLNVDENTKNSASRFFKEKVVVYGVKSAVVGKLAKAYFNEIKSENKKVSPEKKKEIFALCEELFKSDYCEEAYIAAEWAYALRDYYSEEDFYTFEHWIENYVNNWAKCDTLCNHTVGSFIEKFPAYISNLKTWTASENRWLRRAAAVTLVLPARKGAFLEDIFEIADILLQDKDDLVQKGYGWMLKEASKAHQQEIFAYVMKNKKQMPRTALRYAIEKFPKDLRAEAMAK